MTFRLLNGHKIILLIAFSCPLGAPICCHQRHFSDVWTAALCSDHESSPVSVYLRAVYFGFTVQLFCWHSPDLRGQTATVSLSRPLRRCSGETTGVTKASTPSRRWGAKGGGGWGVEEKNTSVAGHSVVEADGPYGLLPLSTGCSSAALIWQEWHLRRGSKPRFNEQRTLLNSLCADRLLLLFLPLSPRFPAHVSYGDERAAVPLHNKAQAQLSSTAASSATQPLQLPLGTKMQMSVFLHDEPVQIPQQPSILVFISGAAQMLISYPVPMSCQPWLLYYRGNHLIIVINPLRRICRQH